LWAIAGVIGFVTASAHAQTQVRDSAGAEELYQAALKFLKTGNWPVACEKFQKSMDLEPAASTQVKIAKCRDHEGLVATAWYDYQRALKLNQELKQTEVRRQELDKFIRASLAELEPRVPKLRITVPNPPAGLEVQRDGVAVSLAVLNEALPVNPGEYELVVTAPGYEKKSSRVKVEAGELVEADLALEKKPEELRPPPAPPLEPNPPAPQIRNDAQPAYSKRTYTSAQRWLGAGLGVAGIATLGVAGYFGLRTMSLIGDMNKNCVEGCNDDGITFHDRAVRAQTAGFVLAGIGTAVVTTGFVLYATALAKPAIEPPRPVAVMLSPGFIGVRGSL
jgi:hypothetical protein